MQIFLIQGLDFYTLSFTWFKDLNVVGFSLENNIICKSPAVFIYIIFVHLLDAQFNMEIKTTK